MIVPALTRLAAAQIERLAEAIHERYLLRQIRTGVPLGATPAMRPSGPGRAASADAGGSGRWGARVVMIPVLGSLLRHFTSLALWFITNTTLPNLSSAVTLVTMINATVF